MEDETVNNTLNYFRTYAKFMDARQVGTLIRKSGKAAGYGIDPLSENLLSKNRNICDAFFTAGKELVLMGIIKTKTQKKANQNILPIPGIIRLLMKSKLFKKEYLILQKTE